MSDSDRATTSAQPRILPNPEVHVAGADLRYREDLVAGGHVHYRKDLDWQSSAPNPLTDHGVMNLGGPSLPTGMTNVHSLDQTNHYLPHVQQPDPDCQQPALQQVQGQLSMRKKASQQEGRVNKRSKDTQGRELAP